MLSAYPHIHQAVDSLCQGASWAITGVSAIVLDRNGDLLLELTKPKHWQRTVDGQTVIGIGAIGGSIEPGEGIDECLRREAMEELGAKIDLLSSPTVTLIYEERIAQMLPAQGGGINPLLFTISANLYRQRELPQADILAIATYLARLDGAPALGDLWGLIHVPVTRVGNLLKQEEVSAAALQAMPDIELTTRTPLPDGFLLKPVWTIRSLQVMLQSGLDLQLGTSD